LAHILFLLQSNNNNDLMRYKLHSMQRQKLKVLTKHKILNLIAIYVNYLEYYLIILCPALTSTEKACYFSTKLFILLFIPTNCISSILFITAV